MESQDLNDILNGAEAPEPAPAEVVEEAAPAETVERPRDEHGRFAPKGETTEAETPPVTQAAPPAATEDEDPKVPRKALQDERSKRQQLWDENQQLRQQLQQLQHPPEPPPSVWDDEQGWEQHFGKTVVNEAVNAATLNATMRMSQMLARQAHADFEEKLPAILEVMDDPALERRALADPHPWDFAYRYVANLERMQQLSAVDVADLEAKLEAKIRAEYEAKAQDTLTNSLPRGVPPSLSQQRNVGTREGPAWAGPAPLGDILNRN